MGKHIRSELLKLGTTRATWGIVIGAVALNIAAFLAPGENVLQELSKPFHEQQSTFFIGFLMRVLLLVLGIRAITDEWRHGTLTPSLLVLPRRARFIITKTASTALFGLGTAALSTAAMVGTAYVVAAMKNVTLGPIEATTIVGLIASGALWAAIGVGLGAILKSQLLATVSGLVWLMAVDDMLRERLGELAQFLPGQAGLALAIAPDTRFLLRAVVTLLVYAAVGLAAGLWLTNRRDVT